MSFVYPRCTVNLENITSRGNHAFPKDGPLEYSDRNAFPMEIIILLMVPKREAIFKTRLFSRISTSSSRLPEPCLPTLWPCRFHQASKICSSCTALSVQLRVIIASHKRIVFPWHLSLTLGIGKCHQSWQQVICHEHPSFMMHMESTYRFVRPLGVIV